MLQWTMATDRPAASKASASVSVVAALPPGKVQFVTMQTSTSRLRGAPRLSSTSTSSPVPPARRPAADQSLSCRTSFLASFGSCISDVSPPLGRGGETGRDASSRRRPRTHMWHPSGSTGRGERSRPRVGAFAALLRSGHRGQGRSAPGGFPMGSACSGARPVPRVAGSAIRGRRPIGRALPARTAGDFRSLQSRAGPPWR